MPIFPPVTWIAPNGGRPSFSRDGSEVVYQNGASLFIVGSKGGRPRVLLTGTNELMPPRADWSWSPFTVAFGGANTRAKVSTIWLIDCDGANLRELPNRGGLTHSTYPSWYQELQSIVAVDSGDPRFHALWRFSVDGNTDPVQLTTTDDLCAGRPSAAPGGSDAPVAFAGTRGPFDEIFNQIWIVRPPSLEAKQLDPRQGRSPNWSPDGKWILFESNCLTGRNYQLFLAPAPGAGRPRMEPRAITEPSIFAQHGEWSRQQDRIVFERGNGQALGVIEVPEELR